MEQEPKEERQTSPLTLEERAEIAKYPEIHPDAVVDPNKARLMADASKNQEATVAEARQIALEAASHIGDGNTEWRSPDNRSAENAMIHFMSEAKMNRAQADELAGKAGEVYDDLKKL